MAQSQARPAIAAFVVVILLSGAPGARSQQPYGFAVADCGNSHNDTGLLGYFCSRGGSGGGAPSCQTYLTFHATPAYSDLAAIAALLGADAASVAAANSAASVTAALAPGAKVLVPVTCSCTAAASSRSHYQRNATYVAVAGDTLFVIANNTFQGLSTCQAVQEQGLGGKPATTLLAGQAVTVPLRCACPSAAQAAAGVRYLVTYLVDEFDELATIAARFGVDAGSISAANEMTGDTIYPFTTLLIPVKSQPDVSQLLSPPPPPPPPPVAPAPTKKRRNHTGLYAGIGVAVAVLAVVAAIAASLALRARRRRARAAAAAAKKGSKGKGRASPVFTDGEVSVSISEAFSCLSDIKSSLKVFTYPELTAATDGFSPDRRVGGSVYRAVFNGDAAAVEVVDRDVSAEVDIMRKINHLNLVRLIGLCHHGGRWYLVSEYAEHGTLRDRLLAGGAGTEPPLSWAQRVQVSLDVAEGLRYLHGYTRPPYVHMDVSSDSILLAAGLRAKIRNFGGARVIRGSTDAGERGGEAFTMTSNIAGTRGYMAPEYLEHGIVSPKADVYSLGVVLLELVTGKDVEELEAGGAGDPFAGLNAIAGDLDDGAPRRMEGFLDPAMAAAGSCPREAVAMMVRLIERCIRRDAGGRPSMGEVAQQLLMLHGISGDGWHSSLEHCRSSGGNSGEQP
ncbi:lysM domain receptor-like kinase 4 [Oryza brachyantha]|uniref:lysM domain receptor-like kinase 4 n=1 Tax=Oryza brachyantha TaxID=4533 RepID=UPI001ADBFB94|nr:lysM domain receptor-like kinase 4 [Oryza brachyantha]